MFKNIKTVLGISKFSSIPNFIIPLNYNVTSNTVINKGKLIRKTNERDKSNLLGQNLGSGLVWKLIFKYNWSNHICALINNYLRKRKFIVQLWNTVSRVYNIDNIVLQERIISPKLYNLFIGDDQRWYTAATTNLQYQFYNIKIINQDINIILIEINN